MMQFEARIQSNERCADGIYTLRVTAPKEATEVFRAGQFLHVKLPHSPDLLLRRPFSVHQAAGDGFVLVYQLAGEGTRRLAQARADETLDMLGPLGNGFPLDEPFEEVWLAGGGVGAVPLLAAAEQLACRRKVFLGFRDKGAAICCKENYGGDVYVTTEDGSLGEKGFVTDMIEKELQKQRPSAIFACGPEPFFKALARVCGDVPVYASLEQRMGCGTGGCSVCTARVDGHMKKVCADGPVFLLSRCAL